MSSWAATKYKTRNWPSHNTALKQRGSLSIWFDPEMTWTPPPTGKRGRQQEFSDAAIQTCLTLKVRFGLPLRQTTGFVESLLRLVGLDWAVPDSSTLCRRQKTLNVSLPYRGATGPLNLLIDSTGIKSEGEGEWNARKHGCPKRRIWRKIHIGIDAETLEVRAVEVTTSNVGDARKCHDAIAARNAHAVIPPRKNAKPRKPTSAGAVTRNEAARASRSNRTDYLHYDQLGSVIGMSGGANSDRDGLAAEHRAYRPFGQISFNQQWGLTLPFESKGFIGERYDADAGLQFLNARYNDPELGTFIQPDWSEVTEAGVGTNRYSYSAIDPINKLDPNGNFWGAIAGWIAGALGVGQLFADIMLFFNVAQSVSAVARGASLGDVLKSWAVSYAIGVVSKAVGSLITIPPGGSDTPFHLESGAVGASTTSGPTAMVGGAADATLPGPVKFLYDTLYASDPNVTYFQHNQGRKLANWIRANKGKRITVIGHSRGGDTAARVVAKGNRISRLVTVDPVRRTVMPKLANVKKYSDVWINYDSKGTGLFGGGNFIATLGRPYNAAPEAFATRHYVKALDHVRICAVYCHP